MAKRTDPPDINFGVSFFGGDPFYHAPGGEIEFPEQERDEEKQKKPEKKPAKKNNVVKLFKS